MAFSNFDYFCFFLCYNCFRIIQLFIRLVKNLLGRFLNFLICYLNAKTKAHPRIQFNQIAHLGAFGST